MWTIPLAVRRTLVHLLRKVCVPPALYPRSINLLNAAANVFAQARIPAVKNVCLWLGADVMAEYPLKDAEEMLTSTLSECEKNLEANHEEWGKVKDCKTTTEVNIARCYNYSVEKKRRLQKTLADP